MERRVLLGALGAGGLAAGGYALMGRGPVAPAMAPMRKKAPPRLRSSKW